MSDEQPQHGEGGKHATPHLPPPSFVPVSVALSLAVLFVGFLGDIRNVVGPAMWLVGLLGLIASLVVWARAARTEYLELPEDASH
ncbi:MAG: hypothetical protein JOY68_03955 [Candidatus Dormibacteraeota bacterium]|nr:hypothetical protein [Candidatus Dormibacteraeota bacterium]